MILLKIILFKLFNFFFLHKFDDDYFELDNNPTRDIRKIEILLTFY